MIDATDSMSDVMDPILTAVHVPILYTLRPASNAVLKSSSFLVASPYGKALTAISLSLAHGLWNSHVQRSAVDTPNPLAIVLDAALPLITLAAPKNSYPIITVLFISIAMAFCHERIIRHRSFSEAGLYALGAGILSTFPTAKLVWI